MEKGDKGSTLTRMGVSGWMFLLVPAYPGCPGQRAIKWLLLLLLLFGLLSCCDILQHSLETNDDLKIDLHWRCMLLHKLSLFCSFILSRDYYQLWLGVRKSMRPVKIEQWGYLSGSRCRLFAYGLADATAIPKPHHASSFDDFCVSLCALASGWLL